MFFNKKKENETPKTGVYHENHVVVDGEQTEKALAICELPSGRTAIQLHGTGMDLVHMYGELSYQLFDSLSQKGKFDIPAGNTMQAAIRAACELHGEEEGRKVNLIGMFQDDEDALMTIKDNGETVACIVNRKKDSSEILAGLTATIQATRDFLMDVAGMDEETAEKFMKMACYLGINSLDEEEIAGW